MMGGDYYGDVDTFAFSLGEGWSEDVKLGLDAGDPYYSGYGGDGGDDGNTWDCPDPNLTPLPREINTDSPTTAPTIESSSSSNSESAGEVDAGIVPLGGEGGGEGGNITVFNSPPPAGGGEASGAKRTTATTSAAGLVAAVVWGIMS